MPVYRIDTFKAWGNREIERSWSNSYEVVSTSTTPSDLLLVANDIILAERAIHLPQVEFLQHRISTYEIEPTNGYDPESFVTTPIEGVGQRAVVNNPEPLDFNVCFVVQRVPATGRAGRLFYRGVLTESDVSAALDGTFRLVTGSTLNNGTAWTAYNAPLQVYVEGDPANEIEIALVMASTLRGALSVRDITALRNGGVSINKRNHRYFDRGPVG